MNRSILLAGAALALASVVAQAQSTAPASSGDPRKGREKTAMCSGCHGIPGWQSVFPEVYKVPKIVGQHEQYLFDALQQYKRGDRTHPSMRAIASTLTEEEMRNLAAYYAQGAGEGSTLARKQ